MFKSLFNKKYFIYGGAIILGKGLEYFVLFFAAHFLSKQDYGELEYYKKFIEIGSNVLAFGFPALILSYTKSKESKTYFYLLSVFFVTVFGSVLSFLGFVQSIWFLLFPAMVFYALFFNGGITQSYQIVQKGSNYASIYKIIVCALFFIAVFVGIRFYNIKGEAYLYPSLILLPFFFLYFLIELRKAKIEKKAVKKYWKLFKKLLYSSLTLVLSNFANLLFFYTNIFVLRFLSPIANVEIADFSFALNIAYFLIIIPVTLIQVDIEKLKNKKEEFAKLNTKILTITAASTLVLIGFYLVFVTYFYKDYQNTIPLFFIILAGTLFSTLSNLYGTMIVIKKKFNLNLNINLIFMTLNIISCVLGYEMYGILGLAACSSFSLIIRYAVLRYFNAKFLN